MFHVIIAAILFVITLVSQFFECSSPNDAYGGAPWRPRDDITPEWFDPKKFVSQSNWYMGTGLTPKKWDKVRCRTNADWQRLVDRHYQDGGLAMANHDTVMKWLDHDRLPAEARFLKQYRVTRETLHGVDSFLMTPYLREWQRRNVLRHIPEGASIFDIGVGTGRSRDLWEARNARVWGVEPDAGNFQKLMRRRIHELRDARNWGGEDARIREWLQPASMDVVMMSYSITFFFSQTAMLDQLVENIRWALKPDGRFILIGMDGAKVDKWPSDKSGTIDNECFRIDKKYTKREPFGSTIEISIKSPFTLVTAQREYLVDFDELTRRLTSLRLVKSEYVRAPYFLAEWPARFVESQRFMVFQNK